MSGTYPASLNHFGRVRSPLLALTIIPEIDSRRAEQYPERSMSLDQIRKSLPTKPVCLNLGSSFTLVPSWCRMSYLKGSLSQKIFFAC